MTADSSSTGSAGPVGTFAEESARLMGAFRDWAARGEATTKAAAAEADSHAHAASGSASTECAHCPICQGLALVRGAKPEVLDHLADAVAALTAALGAFLPGPETPGARAERAGASAASVQHIDVTGDDHSASGSQ